MASKPPDGNGDRVRIGPVSFPSRFVWPVITVLFGGVAATGHVDPFTSEEQTDFGPRIAYQYGELVKQIDRVADVLPEMRAQQAAGDQRMAAAERYTTERFSNVNRQLSELRSIILRLRADVDGDEFGMIDENYWQGRLGNERPRLLQ